MNAKQSAFPRTYNRGSAESGLSKREYFVALAMQGLCFGTMSSYPEFAIEIARQAIRIADETLKALENPRESK